MDNTVDPKIMPDPLIGQGSPQPRLSPAAHASPAAVAPATTPGQAQPSFHEEKEEGIPLLYYWQVVFKHKWKVAIIVFLVVLATAVHVSKLIPLYRASAILLIEQSKSKVVSIENVYDSDYRSQSYIKTQIELMKSRHLVEEVVRQERLDLAPEFNKKKPKKRLGLLQESWIPSWLKAYLPPSDKQAKNPQKDRGADAQRFASLVSTVTSRIRVAPIRGSQLINVSFVSESPELAAKVATAVAQVYIDQTLEARLQMTQNAANWLMKRLGGLRKGLEESERKLQEYRESSGLLGSLEKESMESQQLSSLNSHWLDAQTLRTQSQIRYERFQALMEEYKGHLNELPLRDNTVVENLNKEANRLSMQLAELSSRYGAKHPQIIRNKAELDEIKKKITKEIKRAIVSVKHEYSVAVLQEKKAAQRLKAQKKRLQEYQRKAFVMGNLEREVQTNRQLYELFQKRFKETGVSEGMEPDNARIVDPAKPPRGSYTPNKRRTLSMAIVVGLILGVLLAIGLEYIDRTINNPADLEMSVGIPILAVLPKLRSTRRKALVPEGMMINHPRSPYSEAMRTVRTGIIMSDVSSPPQVILVTSSIPSEGKTTAAINLARAFHMAGEHVLLIEADLRKPRMNNYFQCELNLTGSINNLLVDLDQFSDETSSSPVSTLTGKPSADEYKIVRKEISSSVEGMHLLLCQQSMLYPSEALASKKWSRIMEILRHDYDRIIVDTPPVLAVTDSRIIVTQADGAIFVVMAGRTQRDLVLEATKQMFRSNARILGLILNNLDSKKMVSYGGKGYGGSGYGYGYGYGQTEVYGDDAIKDSL